MQEKLEILIQTNDAKLSELIKKWNQHNITVSEATKLSRALKIEGDNVSNMFGAQSANAQKVVSASQMVNSNLKQMQTEMKGATTSAGGLHQKYFELGTSLRSIELAALKVYAVYQMLNKAMDFAEDASRVELLREELGRYGKKEGFNAALLMERMREATQGSVTEMETLQIAMRAVMMGNIDLNKMPEVMSKLEHYTKLWGGTTQEAFELFIQLAETGNKKAMLKFGIMYDIKKAEEEYLKETGIKKLEYLSDEEKRYISVKAAFAALAKLQNDSASQAEKNLEQFEQFKKVINDLKLAVGDLISSDLAGFLTGVADAAKGVVLVIRGAVMGMKELYYAATGNWQALKDMQKESQALYDKIMGNVPQITLDQYLREKQGGGAVIAPPLVKPRHEPGKAELDDNAKVEKEKEFYPWEKYGALRGEKGISGQQTSKAGSWYNLFGGGIVKGAQSALDERKMKKAGDAWDDMSKGMRNSIEMVSGAVQNTLGNAFESLFRKTENVWARLVQQILADIAMIAVQAGLISLIKGSTGGGFFSIFTDLLGFGGGGGAAGGVGKSMRGSSPSSIASNINNQAMQSRRNSGAGTQHIVVRVVGKYKGGDIALSNEIGQQVLNRQRDGR